MLVEGNEAAEYMPYGGTTIGALEKVANNATEIEDLKNELSAVNKCLKNELSATNKKIEGISGDLYGGKLSDNLFDISRMNKDFEGYLEVEARVDASNGVVYGSYYPFYDGVWYYHPLTDFCDVEIGKTYTFSSKGNGYISLGYDNYTQGTFTLTEEINNAGLRFHSTDEFVDYDTEQTFSIYDIMLVEGDRHAEYVPYGALVSGLVEKVSVNTNNIKLLEQSVSNKLDKSDADTLAKKSEVDILKKKVDNLVNGLPAD
jgi:hypothetical protein